MTLYSLCTSSGCLNFIEKFSTFTLKQDAVILTNLDNYWSKDFIKRLRKKTTVCIPPLPLSASSCHCSLESHCQTLWSVCPLRTQQSHLPRYCWLTSRTLSPPAQWEPSTQHTGHRLVTHRSAVRTESCFLMNRTDLVWAHLHEQACWSNLL